MPQSKRTIAADTTPRPYWQVPGATLYLGDVLRGTPLKQLPTQSVHCVITSPPYWQLRDYQTGQWEGGDEKCNHTRDYTTRFENGSPPLKYMGVASQEAREQAQATYKHTCGKCGARRVDQQLGMEEVSDCLGWATKKPCGECFTCHMVDVFAEVWRVLRNDGTLWLNLGDKYDGDQLLIPSRVALAMQTWGWRLRQDIIWHSTNKMPESVTNRCAKSHEHIFLLTKGDDYYFDGEAIKTIANTVPHARETRNRRTPPGQTPQSTHAERKERDRSFDWSRNGKTESLDGWGGGMATKKDVWIVPTQPYPGCHYAVFSSRLITPCILAGTSEHGCCAECGAPYERVLDKASGSFRGTGWAPPGQTPHSGPRKKITGITLGGDSGYDGHRTRAGLQELRSSGSTGTEVNKTLGWRKTCNCKTNKVIPCTVLDPFTGSGTTVATSIELGRHGVGIDLSETYLKENAIPRIEAAIRGEKVTRKITQAIPAKDDSPPTPKKFRG